MPKCLRLWSPLVCVALLAGPTLADWNLIDDFDAYSCTGNTAQDTIKGKGYWNIGNNLGIGQGDPNFVVVALDPAGGGNQVLKNTFNGLNAMTGAQCNVPILSVVESNAHPYTIFFRARVQGGTMDDAVYAISARQSVATANQKAIVSLAYLVPHGGDANTAPAIAADPNLNLKVVVNNTSEPKDGSGMLAVGDGKEDTWYNFWLVVHNRENGGGATDANKPPLDTYDVYVQGGAFTEQAQLWADGNFRTGNFKGQLPYFNFIVDVAGDTGYLDDLYIDTTGQNLANPVPEPASLLLASGGAAILALRRRRRRHDSV
jgi:hypothetical protein